MGITIDNSQNYINPYNFIRLNKSGCVRPQISKDAENLTGYMECTLTTKTETFMPDTRECKIKKEGLRDGEFKSYVFYSYDSENESSNKPVIPGSEIRGMLRSDFENFTDSCLSTVNTDKSFIGRSKDVKSPGILRKEGNEWHLYKAKRYPLHTTREGKPQPRNAQETVYMVDKKNTIILRDGKNIKTGTHVKFDIITIVSKIKTKSGKEITIRTDKVKEITENGNYEGIAFIGELGGKKENFSINDSVFKDLKEEVRVNDLDKAVKKLKEIYDMYNDSAFNKNLKNGKKWYEGYDIEDATELPVWYSEPDSKSHRTYLSLASIGKEAYHRTMDELLNVSGDKNKSYMPCIKKDNLCRACNLFGFVSSDKDTKDAKGSKIRVSDAIYSGNDNPYGQAKILKELATPHVANPVFYSLYSTYTNEGLLNVADNIAWNYDVDLRTGEAIDEANISIRGRKAYWHHKPDKNSFTTETTVRNCQVTPVKEGQAFKFKIYFENISEDDLKRLIAVINLDYNSNVEFNGKPYYDLCHKIGHAKPLGFGSVKIKVDSIQTRNVKISENDVKYELKDFDAGDTSINTVFAETMNSDAMQDILRIYNFNYIEANYLDCAVTYPLAEHPNERNVKEASHYWFMDNKEQSIPGKKSNVKPFFLMVLPQICEGSEKPLGIKGLNEDGKKTITRQDAKEKVTGRINGLKLPRYKK